MNIEHARHIAKEKIEQLAKELERGHSDTLKEYLSAMARFPNYSARNVLLIHAQRPLARRVAGFGTWKRLGRYVKRDERGIVIMAPTVRHKMTTADADSSEAVEQDDVVVGYRTVCVFDETQTDGAPLPEPAQVHGDPGVFLERLKEFVAQQGIQLSHTDIVAPARGASYGGAIILLPDMTPAEEFSVLSHELAHELLHGRAERQDTTRKVQETEAEAVAYVVCQAIGLDTNTSSSDYLATYRADATTLAASLDRIQHVAGRIVTAIGPDV